MVPAERTRKHLAPFLSACSLGLLRETVRGQSLPIEWYYRLFITPNFSNITLGTFSARLVPQT